LIIGSALKTDKQLDKNVSLFAGGGFGLHLQHKERI